LIQKQQEEMQLQAHQGVTPNFPASLSNLRHTHNLQNQKVLQNYQQQKQDFLTSLQENIPAFSSKVKNDESSPFKTSSQLFTTETLVNNNNNNNNSNPNHITTSTDINNNPNVINSELSQSSQNLFQLSGSSTIQITPIGSLLYNTQAQSIIPSAPFLKFPPSTSGTPLSSLSLSKPRNEADWSLLERSKYQRALIKYGADFSLLSQTIGSKRSGIVRKYYFDQGGARGPENRILLSAHHSLKKIDQLNKFLVELQPSDYEAIKLGTLPKIDLSFMNKEPLINSNSNSNTNSNPSTNTNTSTNTSTNTDTGNITNTITSTTTTTTNTSLDEEREEEEAAADCGVVDPTEKMNESEKKLYKRTRATQILKANNRGIFYLEDDSENFITSLLEKKKRIKKLIPS